MANGFYIGDNRKQRYGKVFQNNRKDSIWNCSTGNSCSPGYDDYWCFCQS